jgi:hypothetical protein
MKIADTPDTNMNSNNSTTETVISVFKSNESLRFLSNRLYTNCIKQYNNQQRRDLVLSASIYLQVVLLCNIFLFYVTNNSTYKCILL